MSSTRRLGLRTSIAGGKLRVLSVSASEAISRPFELEMELESREGALKYDDFLGQGIAAEFEMAKGTKRYWHGLVAAVTQQPSEGDWRYRVRAVPWLWFLTRSADSRVFQEQSVPDVVKQVFRDRGFTDFEDLLKGKYPKRTYCVQYRETAFNFVSRLLEEEGIYYFFKHEAGRHVLVLADGYNSHSTIQGYAEIPYYPSGTADVFGKEHIDEWSIAREVTSGKYVVNDYDFEHSKASLLSAAARPRQHAHGALEIYDYPGGFVDAGGGTRYSTLRLEELQAAHGRAHGAGHLHGLLTGGLFKLGTGSPGDHGRADQNREYLVLSTHHEVAATPDASGGSAESDEMTVSFEVAESSVPYRAPRLTPKPVVHGPQTATVVGSSGEEIWTDEYARIRVQFHWDRVGENNEKSSCWVRVAQMWASNGFGAQFLPRLGDEVVVAFLEGDPDHPVVVGSLYNGTNKPPYRLPGEKTKSGWRTRSSKGGAEANCNELTFEDKKGEEQVLLHAEKDLKVEVENDESRSVDKNRTTKVGGDDSESISGKQAIDVGKTYALKATESITLETGQSKIVMKNDGTIQITGMKITIDATDELKAHGMQVSVKADTAFEGKGLTVKLSADTTMDLAAQAQMTIKGIMVSVEGQVQTEVKGTMLQLTGSAMSQLSGGITMIG